MRSWRSRIAHVATQEMLHLALVHNLLSAIGAAPHLTRPNLPQPANYYPAGVQLALLPFGEAALQHFMFLERPEGMDLADAAGLSAVGRAQPHLTERDIVPRATGLRHRRPPVPVHRGRPGPPGRAARRGLAVRRAARAQATTAHFGWPELIPVTDLASAQRAIDEILEQGEGPRGHWRDAHFGQFVAILDEYQQMLAARPDFDPVRPVVAANVRPHERDTEVRLITDPLTARVADLFNVGYEILLQTLKQFSAHAEETDAQLQTLADTTIALMVQVLRPARRPDHHAARRPRLPRPNRGPSFELFYEGDYLMPHREAAGRCWPSGWTRPPGCASSSGPTTTRRSPAAAPCSGAQGDVPHPGRRAARGQPARPAGHRARPAGRAQLDELRGRP